jgi:SAM-dependent methyltransferase
VNDLNTHYETYKQVQGEKAYTMEKWRNTSRVRNLIQMVQKCAPEGSRVLDIGCGDMYLAKELPQYDWVGIDLAPNMSNERAIKQDLMQVPYPFKDHDFDLVICSEVLEHVWDLRKVHNEVKRLLKPGGRYIISTPNFDNIDHVLTAFRPILFDDREPHFFEHIRQYNLPVHKKFLEKAGFKVLGVTGADCHYVEFFSTARIVLRQALADGFGLKLDQTTVDQLIGQMFPTYDHTIMIVSEHGDH